MPTNTKQISKWTEKIRIMESQVKKLDNNQNVLNVTNFAKVIPKHVLK